VNIVLSKHPLSFYERPSTEVAPDLIGCILHRRLPSGEVVNAAISEVEAYMQDDEASHSFRGVTTRTSVMFGPPARVYVYFIYGMYHCLNVVTESEGTGAAVLIRGLDGEGLNGPGKICREWHIDRSANGLDLLDPASGIWITPRPFDFAKEILISPRIGISKAQDRPWRFYIATNKEKYRKKRK
jgi:DNA-3-methyladenine glycosylase